MILVRMNHPYLRVGRHIGYLTAATVVVEVAATLLGSCTHGTVGL
jgi:hypothetical protein